jgi:hypothetical protein
MPPSDFTFEGVTLAEVGAPGDLTDVREQARALLGPDGVNRLSGPFEGADTADAVWVSVNARAAVESIEISRNWSAKLGPGDMANAVFEAYQAAMQKAFAAAALTSIDPPADGPASAPPASAPPASAPASVSASASTSTSAPASTSAFLRDDEDDEQWLAGIRDTLENIETDMMRRAHHHPGPQETTVASPLGYFTLRVQGNAVVSISGDTRLIQATSGEQLRLDAMAAFRIAQRRGGQDG